MKLHAGIVIEAWEEIGERKRSNVNKQWDGPMWKGEGRRSRLARILLQNPNTKNRGMIGVWGNALEQRVGPLRSI